MKFLKLIGNFLFLFFTIVLTIAFSISLKEKKEHPNFKNLDSKEFIIFGIILLVLFLLVLKYHSRISKNLMSKI